MPSNQPKKPVKTAPNSELFKAKKKALKQLDLKAIPEPCKTLNDNQIVFAETYFQTLNSKLACKKAGYTPQYGTELKKDARIRLYLNYLAEQIDALQILPKKQILEKIGERILDESIENKDLAALSREARYLQGYGGDVNFNQQINIQLPDTYTEFIRSKEQQAIDADWDDVEQGEKSEKEAQK